MTWAQTTEENPEDIDKIFCINGFSSTNYKDFMGNN